MYLSIRKWMLIIILVLTTRLNQNFCASDENTNFYNNLIKSEGGNGPLLLNSLWRGVNSNYGFNDDDTCATDLKTYKNAIDNSEDWALKSK